MYFNKLSIDGAGLKITYITSLHILLSITSFHVQGKPLQFEQWRISHLAEFGICSFSDVSPSAQQQQNKQKTGTEYKGTIILILKLKARKEL